jgi:hypothetical protein
MENLTRKTDKRCSFCKRIIEFNIVIIKGPSISKHRAYICEDCVAVCAMMVLNKSDRYPKKGEA